jgi:hypothetical protein
MGNIEMNFEQEETMALHRWYTHRHKDGETSYLYPYASTKKSYKFFRFDTTNAANFGQFGKASGHNWTECADRFRWGIKAAFGNL